MDGRSAKWFTSARKFPQLIGRTPDGSRLPGGPYTITQVVVAGVTGVLLWNTTWLWARFGLAGNLVVGPSLLFAAVWAAGKIPFDMRNPLVVASGWASVIWRLGDPGGFRLPPPHRGRSKVLMIAEPSSVWVEELAPEDPGWDDGGSESWPPAESAGLVSVEPGLPALSGVQRLLAARS